MTKTNALFLVLALTASQAWATAKPAITAAVAPQTAASAVDDVLQLKKAGLSDDIILSKLRKGKAVDLSTDDMIKLKTAGVSNEIIQTMINPAAVPAAQAPAQSQPAAPANTSPAPASAAVAPAPAGDKKRVAIAPFKFSAPMNELQAAFGTSENIGTGVKALMTEQLTQSGKLTVVESDLSFLNQELGVGNSGAAQPGSGARLGKMQGADLVLQGDILIFGRDDQKKSGALGGFGGGIGGILGGGNKQNRAVVVISYRLINLETREIILSAQARGESKREDKNIFGGLVSSRLGGGAGGGLDMTSSNFAQTILGEATIDCAQKLAAAMLDKAMTIPTRFVDVEGRVAAVNGSKVTINKGGNDSVQVGDVFDISKVTNEVHDPVTHEVIGLELEPAGQLTIVDVQTRTSSGNYVGAAVANNDVARKKKP